MGRLDTKKRVSKSRGPFSNRPGSETVALFLALFWLISITLLHFYFSYPKGAQKQELLRVGFLPITCHLLLPVAIKRDDYLKSSIDPVKYSSWPDMIESLKGGELDAALILAPIALSLQEEGVPIRIALLGHREGTGLVVSLKSHIKGPGDFMGKTVAIPIRFSTQNLTLLRYLKQNGIGPDSLNLVELPPPDMPSALASGSIDAYIVGEPYATQGEFTKKGRIFLRSRDLWPNFISSILVLRQDAIDKKGQLVNRFIKGLYSQARWVEENRTDAAIIAAKFFGLPEGLIRAVLEKKEVFYRDLIPKKEELIQIARMMKGYGLTNRVPPCRLYLEWLK